MSNESCSEDKDVVPYSKENQNSINNTNHYDDFLQVYRFPPR